MNFVNVQRMKKNLKIEVGKEKTASGSEVLTLKLEGHGLKGHDPVLTNSFISVEGLIKWLGHYIGQYVGQRGNKDKDKVGG